MNAQEIADAVIYNKKGERLEELSGSGNKCEGKWTVETFSQDPSSSLK